MGQRPNILFIVTDQEYAHQALPAGVTLPNRDRLRSKGVTFNQHQATTSVCTPSRSVMWTGQHTPFTRMFDNTNFAWIEDMRADPENLPTIGHMLRDLGYYTAYKGKWHESEFAQGNTKDAMEPFGFADGISQPLVEGTPKARGKAGSPDLVAAGEFILGYRDQRGFVPPALAIPAARDPDCLLPVARERAGEGGAGPDLPRDFGRNGSYLVVRHLAQDVDGFQDYCRQAAEAVRAASAGPGVTPQWIGAKMMGRWHNGSSLVRHPHAPADGGRQPDNDFRFASEDPQGLHCPLGSHVRRSNPRDSLGPDRAAMTAAGQRHRLLRVGRNWRRLRPDGGTEQGLFFMCLNADIERQFEFVQQTWISAPLFHGLIGEKDPVIGRQDANARFTIPDGGGGIVLPPLPTFVTVLGGGYLFMPSRSALAWMVSRL